MSSTPFQPHKVMAASSPSSSSSVTVEAHSTPLITSVQRRFYASPEYTEAREALQRLADNPQYATESDYHNGSGLDFVDRHLQYLSTHPTTNLIGYISNLKLMTSTKHRG